MSSPQQQTWPAVSSAVGLTGLLLAAVPHGVGLIGAAAAGFGVAAGTAGILLARPGRRPVLAVSGIAVSVLAVVLAGAVGFGYPRLRGHGPGTVTEDTATVLGRELDVQIGTFSYAQGPASKFLRIPSVEPELMVTLTNKLADSRRFSVVIAAFESQRFQIGTFQAYATLAGGATRTVDVMENASLSMSLEAAQRLRAARFAVLAAGSDVPERP